MTFLLNCDNQEVSRKTDALWACNVSAMLENSVIHSAFMYNSYVYGFECIQLATADISVNSFRYQMQLLKCTLIMISIQNSTLTYIYVRILNRISYHSDLYIYLTFVRHNNAGQFDLYYICDIPFIRFVRS